MVGPGTHTSVDATRNIAATTCTVNVAKVDQVRAVCLEEFHEDR
jgi:hypothetical protein